MHTKEDVISFRDMITLIALDQAKKENVNLYKLTELELSKYVFDAITEKLNEYFKRVDKYG